MNEHSPSTRARINNLVQAYSKRTGRRPGAVWVDLYTDFESLTNKPWRKMANYNGTTPMGLMQALRQLDAFLDLARTKLCPPSDSEPAVEVSRV